MLVDFSDGMKLDGEPKQILVDLSDEKKQPWMFTLDRLPVCCRLQLIVEFAICSAGFWTDCLSAVSYNLLLNLLSASAGFWTDCLSAVGYNL